MQLVANIMLRRFARNTRGAVLVEFAFALPVLLVLYLGGISVSDMIACSRKTAIATRSLVDLVSRTMSPAIIYNNPSSANARTQLSASAVVLSPYKLNNATQQVSLVRVCDATHAYVVWTQAQTQSADGSTVTATTSSHTAGTLPTSEAQAANTIITIPSNMVTTTMIPTSPDASNVCGNLAPGTSTKTQVGTAGGWLFVGTVTYSYTPGVSFFSLTPTPLTNTIYMVPRLF
ncbi:MAG: TadE/TadG family type IV pilus assembly protein [Novosphingobium sp.]